MALSTQQKSKYVNGNRLEYDDRYDRLYFPDPGEMAEALAHRNSLLVELAETAVTGCLGTKLNMADLSPGCRTCVDGRWSCLFINGKCNGNCFYCPTSQNEIGRPTTNSVTFNEPKEYVSYLERFGFRGASISGGEPLLTLDASVRFVRVIKRHFGEKIHVWLYTNGILANKENLMRLRDAGLDEIRFDIGATGYSLQQLAHAVGIMPTVTVEIPAVPEEEERLKELLPILIDTGVKHLNLHQLRLTPHNFEKLVARGYRFLHGEKVTVLDSEITALEILAHGAREGISLPINYCSFPYKNRFQARAARIRNAAFICKGYEVVTGNGFIRTMALVGDQDALLACTDIFARKALATSRWQLTGNRDKLYIHPDLLSCLNCQGLTLVITYSAAYQRQSASYRNPFINVEVSKKKKIVIEKETRQARFELSAEEMRIFVESFLPTDDLEQSTFSLPAGGLWEELIDFERTRPGLADYY